MMNRRLLGGGDDGITSQRATIHAMADWSLEAGLYLLGVAVVPPLRLLLVCWWLWGDRGKGRPRCPQCWYDLRGTLPWLECPERGHNAGQEGRLYKIRRRWWRIVLGVVLALLSCYLLTIIGGWYRERAVVQWLSEPGHAAGAPKRIGPEWLLGQLPDKLAQFFDGRAGTGQ